MIANGTFHKRAAPLAAALALSAAVASGQTPGSASVTGEPARGKSLYEQTYRCYACHGYNGETTALGVPRLVPMARSQEAFIAYLRKPSTPGMPSYPNVPAQDLADIYAHLRSRKSQSPSAESVPLLKALLDRVKRQH